MEYRNHRGASVSWICPFCDLELVEDVNHMNWDCPAWARFEDEMAIPHSETEFMHLPNCFLQHGIVAQDMLVEGKPACEEDEELIFEIQRTLARIAQARATAWARLQEQVRQGARPSGNLRERERKRRRLVVV